MRIRNLEQQRIKKESWYKKSFKGISGKMQVKRRILDKHKRWEFGTKDTVKA